MSTDRVVTGHEQINAVLLTLEKTVADRIARGVLTRSASHVAKHIRAQVHIGGKGTGKTGYRSIRQSIGHRVKRLRRSSLVEAKAGVSVGRGYKQGVPHAQMFGAGSGDRYTSSGAYRGRMPKNEMVRRGFVAAQGGLRGIQVTAFRKGIDREIKKLARRRAK